MPLPVLAPLTASYPVRNFTARYPWNVWLLWALEDRIETLGAAVTFVDSAADRRIDVATKERATAALDAMGLSVSDAIRLLMLRVAEDHRLPFEVKAPSASSHQALAEIEAGQVERFDSVEALMADLHAGD